MASNLKPAPLSLTAAVTAKLVGDRPAFGKGVVQVPFGSFKLVDGKRRLDLNTVPSAMEMRAASWRREREDGDG